MGGSLRRDGASDWSLEGLVGPWQTEAGPGPSSRGLMEKPWCGWSTMKAWFWRSWWVVGSLGGQP